LGQRKSATVALGITALLAPSLAACSSNDDVDNQAVCVDQQTQERVDDSQCDDSRGGGFGASPFLWYFLGTTVGRGFPGIGQRVPAGGTYSRPPGSYRLGGVPRTGGNVPRGGFGGGSRSSGG
jgi:hypothetical protein